MLFDNEKIKNRRRDNIDTTDNDINRAHDIIEKQGYELINFMSHEYFLSIVTKDECDVLCKLEQGINSKHSS
jgi:hypothetical protein